MTNTFPTQTFQTRYRSGDFLACPREFYNQVLPCTKKYFRAVGFFSSTSFIEISYGILEMVKNGGKMYLITSPRLSDDDIEAIEKGYEGREEIYLRAFKREMKLPSSINAENRLNILANLIEDGILEIKIAVTENPRSSMYHEKIGLFVDGEGNKIAISGSNNESETAISENFESFQVFCGWYEGDRKRVETVENDFNMMWENRQEALSVFSFSALPKAFVEKYKTKNCDKDFKNDEHLNIDFAHDEKSENQKDSFNDLFFNFSDSVSPRPHQRKAIKQFVQDEFQCLFAMATGTGKTLTSLFAANELSCYIPLKTILIIVPLKDLVDQWEKDVRKYFSGEVIPIRSGLDWKEKLTDIALLSKLSNSKASEKRVLITTYDSFVRNDEKILSVLNPSDSLIIADEVHKFGAKTYSQKLPQNIQYRIGLSATPKRAYDDKGTAAIFDYFCPSEKPFEFTIKNAIDADMLCHYVYTPITVPLSDDEVDKYSDFSEQISKLSLYLKNAKNPQKEDEERLQNLLINRHRIIERASGKLERFLEIMEKEVTKYKDKTIIFCPAGTDENENDFLETYKTELWKRLSSKGKIVRMSEYVQGTHRKIIDDFTNGSIDILFAKQRLNEGIDIPAARRAFFIASSTSEREFIQRRGRVLRKSAGKKIAEIFDFIVVPSDKNYKYASAITVNEIKRAMDFAVTADNFSEIEHTLKNYL